MGFCQSSNQPIDSISVISFEKAIKSELIDKLNNIEQQFIQSYENYSLLPMFKNNHFIKAIFFKNNLVYKNQNYDTIIKRLKESNETYQDQSFTIKTNLILIEKISNLFYLNNEKDLYEGLCKICFVKELFKLQSSPKANSNLFNALLYIQLKNKYWVKNILYKSDYKRRIFLIKLFINSYPKLIPIDEIIPVNDNYTPYFFNPAEKLYWILLIEKALAKSMGGYEKMINCRASEIFPYLTDAPLITYHHCNHGKGKTWSLIKEQLKGCEILFAEGNQCSSLSFFIYGCFIVNNNKYLELIIPDCFTKDIIANVKKSIVIPVKDLSQKEFFPDMKIKSEKIIFMKFDYYYSYFERSFLLKYHNDYMHQIKRISIDSKHSTLIQFKSMHSSNQLFLSLYKKSNNNMLHRITIGRVIQGDDDQIEFYYVDSIYLSTSTTRNTLDLKLIPAVYYIIIQGYSTSPNQLMPESGKITLSFYSTLFIDINEEENDLNILVLSNIDKIMVSLFKSYLDQKGLVHSIENSNEIMYKHSISDILFGYSIISIENNSMNMILSLSIEYKIKGMNLLLENENNEIDLVIPPNKKQIIIFEWYQSINDIAIDLKPKFELRLMLPINIDKLSQCCKEMQMITKELSVIEIPYCNGSFIIINNTSLRQAWKVKVIITEMINCNVDFNNNSTTTPTNRPNNNINSSNMNTVNQMDMILFIPSQEQKYINLVAIQKYKLFSYEIAFTYEKHNH